MILEPTRITDAVWGTSVRGEVGTGLNIEEIVASGLPPQLKTFASDRL
jgi:hypothetical protein